MYPTKEQFQSEIFRTIGMKADAAVPVREDIVQRADATGHHPMAAAEARMSLVTSCLAARLPDRALAVLDRLLNDYPEWGESGPWMSDYEDAVRLRRGVTYSIRMLARFPEVPLPRIAGALTTVERHFVAGGHNLADVHAARRWVAQLVGDWEEEERSYRLWKASDSDRHEWVDAFEPEIERLVLRGDEMSLVRARELAGPLLAGEASFQDPPTPVQSLLVLPMAQAGELSAADPGRTDRIARAAETTTGPGQ